MAARQVAPQPPGLDLGTRQVETQILILINIITSPVWGFLFAAARLSNTCSSLLPKT
jgi:hypothetical protein